MLSFMSPIYLWVLVHPPFSQAASPSTIGPTNEDPRFKIVGLLGL